MIKKKLRQISSNLISFLHVQLFITLISLPILVSWGMPLSLLTVAGNFLFSPILTLFLLLSSLFFFCTILHIPTSFLAWSLHWIVTAWLWIMECANQRVLICLPKPSIILLLCVPLAALVILHHQRIVKVWQSILGYSIILGAVCAYLLVAGRPAVAVQTLDCNKGKLTIIQTKNELTLIDPGYLGRRISAPSWCQYTLMPYLAQTFGSQTIDHLIVLRPGTMVFEALSTLVEKCTIKTIYLVVWDGTPTKSWWRSYFTLVDTCKKYNCTIRRVKKKVRINFSSSDYITLDPHDEIIKRQEIQYHATLVSGMIDNQPLEIYSSNRSNKSTLAQGEIHGTSENSHDCRT